MADKSLEKRTSDLIEALLVAQISNIDPEDHKRIIGRWQFLISEAIGSAMDDARAAAHSR